MREALHTLKKMIPQNNEIRFEVSTKCNYHCLMCPRDELVRKKETMSFDEFQFYLDKISNETNQYNTVTFSGFGEALLDPTLLDKMSYAKNKGYRILLLTTGSLLTLDKFKRMNEIGLESIRISLHGSSKDTYTLIHNPGKIYNSKFFEKVKKLVTEISALPRSTKIILTYVKTKQSEKDLEDFISYWKDKVDLIEAWQPHNWVDGRDYRDTKSVEQFKTCGRPEKGPLQIQVDGTINMCCFDFNGQLLLGDLKKQSLKEIFNMPAFQEILQCHKTGKFDNTDLICKGCDQRNKKREGIMLYNSSFDPTERVFQLSTTYQKVT